MDLFDLAAKLTLDSSQYEKAVSSAAGASKTAQKAVDSLRSPIDRVRGAFEAVKNPVQTVKKGWENLKSAANNLAHPIQTMKTRLDESQTAAQKNQSIMAGLAKDYDKARDKVAQLTAEYKKSVAESGNTSDKSIALAKAVDQAEKEAAQAEQAMTEYAESLKKTGKDSDSTAEKQHKLAGALKSGITGVAKGVGAAVAASAVAVSALVKQSVEAYSEYEQLVGGVEKLYGEASETVLANAKKAYATAGMSMNQYMDNAVGLSAFMVQSVGGDTQKAAEMIDLAMRDISDNANTFGKYTVEELTGVYQAIAKGQYQTLDNLQLPFAGTKAGMEELIAHANDLKRANGELGDLTIDKYADIVEAIHLVQVENHLSGLSAEEAAKMVREGVLTEQEAYEQMGTTAREAATTIQGSLGMTKAAWENLLTSLGDKDADIGEMVDNLIGSATYAVQNITPVILQALKGVGKAVKQLAPALAQTIADLAADVAPDLISASITLLIAFGNAIVNNADKLIDAAFNIIDTFVEYLADPDGLLKLIDAALILIEKIADGLTENLPTLIPAIVDIVLKIVEKLTDPESFNELLGAALSIIMALVEGISNSLPEIVAKAPEIITNLVLGIAGALAQITLAAGDIILTLIDGIVASFDNLIANGGEVVTQIGEGIKQKFEDAKNWGKDMIENFVKGITEKWDNLKKKVVGIADWIMGLFGHSHPKFGPMKDDYKWMPDMMDSFTKGIADNENKFKRTAARALDLSGSVTMPDARGAVSINGSNADLTAMLRQYLPMIANRDIVLDSGELVGSLAYKMDGALGARTAYAARGMA